MGLIARVFRAALIALLLLAVLAALAFWRGWVERPPTLDASRPLQLHDPPGAVTTMRRQRMLADSGRCLAFLERTPLRFTPVADQRFEGGCRWTDTVLVRGGHLRYGADFTLTCPMAASWALFEFHALRPLALEVLGSPVVAVEHYGSYACRNVYGRASGRLSEHATANAFDVAGFRLADGRRITVAADWGDDDAQARFLHRVHDAACDWFGTVLGPAYNAAHADHFHLDRGGFRSCR